MPSTLAEQNESPDARADARAAVEHDHFEQSLKQNRPLLWWSTLLAPFVVTLVILSGLSVANEPGYFGDLVVRIVMTFFFFGRFVILDGTGSPLSQFSSEKLFLMVFYMDVMTACLLTFHAGFLFKLPFFGMKLRGLVDDGQIILRAHPWMRRTTFLAIVLFVMFPLAATGSIGGSLFGRLMGMSRWSTFVGVVLGSFLGCAAMYFGASLIAEYLDPHNNPLVRFGGIAFVVVIILALNHRYRKFKASHQAAMAKEQ